MKSLVVDEGKVSQNLEDPIQLFNTLIIQLRFIQVDFNKDKLFDRAKIFEVFQKVF